MNLKKPILLLSAAIAFASARADVAGHWVNHPALDIYSYLSASKFNAVTGGTNNVQRLIDTERWLYALIACGHFVDTANSLVAYKDTPFVLARLDKNDPEGRMTPVATALNVSGIGVTSLEYSKKLKCVAVTYDNGCIDFIYDDGRVVSNTELSEFRQPGGLKMRSVSFSSDDRKAVVATQYGIVVIDIESAGIDRIFNFKQNVNFANIFGDYMIASAGGTMRVFPLSDPPASLEDAAPLKSTTSLAPSGVLSNGAIKSNFGLYPLSDKMMLFFAPILSGSSGVSANVLTLPDNPLEENCRVTNLMSVALNYRPVGSGDYITPGFHNAPLVSPTRDGYMLWTDANVYLFNVDGKELDYTQTNAATNYKNAVLKTLRKDQSAGIDNQAGAVRYKPVASYDGEKFWVFRPKHGFQKMNVSGTGNSAVWTADGDIMEAGASAAGMPRYLYYSPKYGLIARNNGTNFQFTNDNGQTDGLSSYKDGKWTVHTVSKTNYKDGWLLGTGSLLLGNGRAATPDPVYPDYFYMVDWLAGIRRHNLADYEDVMLMTRSNYGAAHANRAVLGDPQTGSIHQARFAYSEFDFDNDGTLWTAFNRLNYPGYEENQGEIWYWTAADRGATKTGADYADHPMQQIIIPGLQFSSYGRVYALKQEKNVNLIAVTAEATSGDAIIYDHNGTPEDTSDDRYVNIDNLYTPEGDEVGHIRMTRGLIEDPFDGSLIIGSIDGIFTVSRESLFGGERPVMQWLSPRNEKDGSTIGIFGAGGLGGCIGMTVDRDLRKWFVFENGQVVCLSPDRSTILADYNPDNSPLPSGNYYSICYNPDTNSIFIGSNYGLTELCLEGGSSPFVRRSPSVSPRVAETDYSGHINIFGLEDASSYTLVGPDGAETELSRPVDGRIQLHPSGLKPGTYSLKGWPDVEFIINR